MKTSTKIVVGATVALFLYDLYRKPKPPRIFVKDSLSGGFNAKTIPPFGIFIKKEQANNTNLINHEKVHWNQYQKLGLVKFYTNYISEYLKYGYDKMPMEHEARFIETEFCKANYTHCVKNGIAKTVNNSNFRIR